MGIHLVDKMEFQPGCCVACRNTPMDDQGDPKPAIDFDSDVDWGDTLYICSECIEVAAELLGYLEPEKAKKLLAASQGLKAKIEQQAVELRELRELKERIVEVAV